MQVSPCANQTTTRWPSLSYSASASCVLLICLSSGVTLLAGCLQLGALPGSQRRQPPRWRQQFRAGSVSWWAPAIDHLPSLGDFARPLAGLGRGMALHATPRKPAMSRMLAALCSALLVAGTAAKKGSGGGYGFAHSGELLGRHPAPAWLRRRQLTPFSLATGPAAATRRTLAGLKQLGCASWPAGRRARPL